MADALGHAPSSAARRVLKAEPEIHVPAIFLAEIASALRSMLRRGAVDEPRARKTLSRAGLLQRTEHAFAPFASRVWELRSNVTVYDAWYIALAERLGATLLTADARLARSPGARCEIALIG